jgi:hypothetical protein
VANLGPEITGHGDFKGEMVQGRLEEKKRDGT